MKHLGRIIIALFLVVLIGGQLPARVLAAANTADYISEIKVFIGDYTTAEAEGFTLLKYGNNPVDLNQNAGGGLGSKGEKAVYLGYKTTKNRDEAITDLALMNMKGGYDVAEYEALFDTYLKSQITPLAQNLISSIEEYRANINSENDANRERATYVKKILNKFIDDDTGKGLGNLLLNETKFEMGDEAYNALSDTEKKKHADLLTILSQANGKATLMLESLLVRASDNNDTTWVERLSSITYDDLVDATGLTPTDAKRQLAKLYDDDAYTILSMWKDFREILLGYDDALAIVEDFDEAETAEEIAALKQTLEDAKEDDLDEETVADFAQQYADLLVYYRTAIEALQTVAIYDALDEIEYDDGTMLDFFMLEPEELEDDITVLYPLVASFTAGQRAGLEFVSLRELVNIALTNTYSNAEEVELAKLSIYDGVDRAIYEKGGVALTTDARRSDAMNKAVEEDTMFSGWTIAMMSVTGATFAAFTASAISWATYALKVKNTTTEINRLNTILSDNMEQGEFIRVFDESSEYSISNMNKYKELKSLNKSYISSSNTAKWLSVGFGVAAVILAGFTTYLAWEDMKAYYNVDFTPIPHYMVDEKDIIGYNSKGEKIMLKNQSAYYKVAECNRAENAEMYNMLGTSADMNGDVGRQWLALYTVKNEAMLPILASSLKVVVGSVEVPAGYETGIHMFGSDAAFNLNSSLYDWNNSAPSVYVYFQTDETAPATTGANFTGGTLALAGGAGIIIGVVLTALVIKIKRKPEKQNVATA